MSFSSELKSLFEKYDVVIEISETSGIVDFYTNRGIPTNVLEHVVFRNNSDVECLENAAEVMKVAEVMKAYEH